MVLETDNGGHANKPYALYVGLLLFYHAARVCPGDESGFLPATQARNREPTGTSGSDAGCCQSGLEVAPVATPSTQPRLDLS